MIIPDNINIKDLPIKIQYLYIALNSNIPVGTTFYEECIKEYPEYFSDVFEWQNKIKKVPQKVHDAYNKEVKEKFNYKGNHLGNGLRYYISHQKEIEAEIEDSNRIHGTYTEIWNRHYEKYGLKK